MSETKPERYYSPRWPCACGHARASHRMAGKGLFGGPCGAACCDCKGYDSADCLRGSPGCEIPGRHDLCGLVVA